MSELEPYAYDAHDERELRGVVAGVVRGRVNWVGELELTADGSATETVVEDDRVTEDSEISLSPLTADAAALLGKVFVSSLEPGVPWANPVGRFTVDHPKLAVENYSFRYSIKG